MVGGQNLKMTPVGLFAKAMNWSLPVDRLEAC
jgi:hypothetical protein